MFKQILEISVMNLRNLPSRLGSSSVIVVGIAGVVGVLIAILSMAVGFATTLDRGGEEDRGIILRGGTAQGELTSNIDTRRMLYVGTLDGVELSSAEVYMVADIPKRSNLSPANVVIRGVEQDAFAIRPEINIIEGRNFETGRNELIAGRSASREFVGIDLGAEVNLRNSDWTIVGIFGANGSAYESELWADMPTTQSAFQRQGAVNSMRVKVSDPAEIATLQETFDANPQVDLQITSEEEFFNSQSEQLSTLISSFGYAVAAIMAIGAVFAALNTMYSAVATRTVEIATLRALGFGALPVVVSVMIEAIVLALMGGVLGAAIAYFGFNGYTASTLNQGSFSQVAFDFAVTPQLIQSGIIWALGLGVIGGLFPAVRAARLPITVALRGE
mgnify:FL=1|jgi:putative ABC transport system permease protein